MKNVFIAAASAAAVTALVPAFAQAQTVTAPTGVYGSVGYANADAGGFNIDAIQGRLGYRMNNYFGVEGELATGLKSDRQTETVSGVTVNESVKLRHQEAIYAVGFVPVSPNFDVIGRVGYGNTNVRARATATGATGPITLADTADGDSWNYGAGVQYHFDGVNGVRADFTRHDYRDDGAGHANVWSVAYTRRF